MKRFRKQLISWLLILAMVLTLLPVFGQPAVAAEAEESVTPVRFPSDVTSYDAECPVCKKTVTWKPYNGENNSESDGTQLTGASSAHFHLYLTKDHTYAAEKNFLISYRNVCFNLNGYDVTASAGSRVAFACARKMSIIDTYGGSVVTGYNYISDGTGGAAIHANNANASIHIYGGTWTKLAADTWSPILRVSTKGGAISLYEGAVVDATGLRVNNTTAGGAVGLDGTTNKATFYMYGGEIKGGSALTGGSVLVGAPNTGNDSLAAFYMYGGTISGGSANKGAEIFVSPGASFSMSGGSVKNEIATSTASKISLSGASEILGKGLVLATGVVASIDGLTQEAAITLQAPNGAQLTTAREDAASLQGVITVANGAALLAQDNCFYSFCGGMAILGQTGQVAVYETAAAAMESYYADSGFANKALLVSGEENQQVCLAGDAYIDTAGKAITVTGTGRLFGMDSGNDAYDTAAGWTIEGAVAVQTDVTNPLTGYRYLFVNNGYHRLDLSFTHVTLRTAGQPGMYYKAKIACDETLAALVTGYGTALSIEKMPGLDFAESGDVEYTAFTEADFDALYQAHQVSTTSCVLVDVLNTANTKRQNTTNVKTNVYANLYVTLRLEEETLCLLADEENCGKTLADPDFDGVACSMLQLVKAINEKWTDYSPENRKALESFVASWTPYVQDNTFPELNKTLLVGFGRTDITPEYSVPLAGYGNTQNRMSTGIQDRIYTTCTAITDAYDQTLLLISQDLVTSEWAKDARTAISAATGVPEGNIMVASTHTHAAPDIRSDMAIIQTYKQEYLVQITAAAVAAMADRSEAVAYAGAKTLERMNFVRHYLMADGTYAGDNFGSFTNNTIVDHAEENDDLLQVIKFARGEKKDVVMVNWQAHPTLGTSSSATKITSSFIGPARDHFEETTGELFIYFTGAAGNQNPTSKISSENLTKDNTEYGELLSKAVIGVLEEMDTPHIREVKTEQNTYVGNINHTMEDKLEQAKAVKAVYDSEGKTAGNKLAVQYGFSSVYHANAVIRRSELGQTMDIIIDVATLGGISFVFAPYEMFAAHGVYIRENAPGMTFLVTCANDRYGYLPTTKAYDYGCYESHTSNFSRETGEELASVYVDMLNALAK